ncbi:hypothetical protein V8F20_001815 [Naviculisporaceae sp. PSN 640]
MQFSKVLAGVAFLISSLTAPVMAGVTPNSATLSQMFEKRGECGANSCSKDSDCNRFCTDGCVRGRCTTSFSTDRPGGCARGCKINSVGELVPAEEVEGEPVVV